MKKILYIEDCKDDALIFKRSFAEHDVVVVENLKEAEKHCHAADIVVIDINLTIENGYEVFAKLNQKHPDKDYVITSGCFPGVVTYSSECSIISKDRLVGHINGELLNGST